MFNLLSIASGMVAAATLFSLFFLCATASSERRHIIFTLGTVFLLVTAAQIGIILLAVAGRCSAIMLLYWPVKVLTDVFVPGQTEADVGAGFFFIPPVVLFYSLVLTALVGVVKKHYGR